VAFFDSPLDELNKLVPGVTAEYAVECLDAGALWHFCAAVPWLRCEWVQQQDGLRTFFLVRLSRAEP
jgi:hypothetical protein